jgi:hypothetical protein
MSLPQITLNEWFLLLGIVVGWLVIIIFMVRTRRRLSRLQADFNLLSDQLTDLMRAEETLIMRKMRDPKNKGRARSVKAEEPPPSLGPH